MIRYLFGEISGSNNSTSHICIAIKNVNVFQWLQSKYSLRHCLWFFLLILDSNPSLTGKKNYQKCAWIKSQHEIIALYQWDHGCLFYNVSCVFYSKKFCCWFLDKTVCASGSLRYSLISPAIAMRVGDSNHASQSISPYAHKTTH